MHRSVTKLCLPICDPMDGSMLGFPVHHYPPEFAQIHVHWVSDAIQPSHPLSPSSPLPSLPYQGLFQWAGSSNQVAKYWSFRFSISPSNKRIQDWFLRTDWLDLLAVQGTLKSLFQHHNSKASILWQSAFLMVQLSHLYMTTRKTIPLTMWPLPSKWYLCFLIGLSQFGQKT